MWKAVFEHQCQYPQDTDLSLSTIMGVPFVFVTSPVSYLAAFGLHSGCVTRRSGLACPPPTLTYACEHSDSAPERGTIAGVFGFASGENPTPSDTAGHSQLLEASASHNSEGVGALVFRS